MQIAIVHDWLVEAGEKEKLLFALMELFPGADIYTLVYQPEKFDKKFEGRRVTASFLQRLPFGKAGYKGYLPLYWGFMRGFNLSSYDLIISTNSLCAKWFRNPKKALHVCYCQELLDGAWMVETGQALPDFPKWEVEWFLDYLKRCDLKSNAGVTHFLAGTEEMKSRIQKAYGREAEVIPYPIDAKFQFRSQIYFRKLFGIQTIPENDKF